MLLYYSKNDSFAAARISKGHCQFIYILLASICIAVKTVVYKFSRVSLTLKLTYLLDHMRKCVLCLYHVILSICLLIF
jgi:hypothetical protein